MEFYFIWFAMCILILAFNKEKNNICVKFIFILCALIYGCRDFGGIDDPSYINGFYGAINNQTIYGFENSFIIISKLLGFLGFNYKGMFLLYASMSFIFMYLSYKELCENKYEWIIVIIGFFNFLFIPTITIMRQFLAATIIMYALILRMKNKKKISIIMIFVASIIHQGAIFILFILPIFNRKIDVKIKIIIPLISLFIVYAGLANIIFNIISQIIPYKYKGYLGITNNPDIGLLHTILIIVYLAQNIMSILNNKKVPNRVDFLERGQMIYFCLYFITLSSGWLNRMSSYLMLFVPFIFITMISKFPLKRDKNLLYILCCLLSILLFVYQIIKINNVDTGNLIPYVGSFKFIE